MSNSPQVKICGLTSPETAAACAEAGADAIGFIFFEKSPRHLTVAQAAEIRAAVPGGIAAVGVFVNEGYDEIMRRVDGVALTGVQLHGGESQELVARLQREGLLVVKALFTGRDPGLDKKAEYHASAYLVECGLGPLPGGNAETWQWQDAAGFAETAPLIVAGGLDADNVAEAVRIADPDAVDVSSGVEFAPGKKDLEKVRAFIAAVKSGTPRPAKARPLRQIF
jgi:phosphoribosylanthranilate isomerase